MNEPTAHKKRPIEKLADSFGLTTGKFLEDSQRKVELAKAAGEREEIIKAQIKFEVLRQTRKIFAYNYKQITGNEPWSEDTYG